MKKTTKNNKNKLKWVCTRQPMIVCVAGESGTGKTTLIVELVKELTKGGIRVGTIKHASKGFSLDDGNKDSGRHKSAGAKTAMVVSKNGFAIVKDEEFESLDCLREYCLDVNLIIAEGFKNADQPKIILHHHSHRSEKHSEGKKYTVDIIDKNWNRRTSRFGFDNPCELAKLLRFRYIIGPKS